MLTEQHLVALLVKIAVAASVASILMRFRRIRRVLLRDDRTVAERLQLALIFSFIFGAGETARIMTQGQYQAIDLAMESALIAGLLAGYVSGLVTGICVSIPAMFHGEYMAMPLFSAAGVLGGLLRDLAPTRKTSGISRLLSTSTSTESCMKPSAAGRLFSSAAPLNALPLISFATRLSS